MKSALVLLALIAAAATSVSRGELLPPPPAVVPPAKAVAPSARAMAAALRFARSRAGLVSVAIVDSAGASHGWRQNRAYASASVVKAMLLVSYLRQASWRGLRLDEDTRRDLEEMIVISDNDPAGRAYELVGGDGALYSLAHSAGMRFFAVHGYWSSAQITARDEARLFFRLDELVPAAQRPYARRLLSSIVSYQRWGIPRAARGWHVYFKGGWLTSAKGELVHQVALLERGGRAFALAILTDGNPSQAYGRATIEGIAARSLRGLR
jgi:beta-lactamase family protein